MALTRTRGGWRKPAFGGVAARNRAATLGVKTGRAQKTEQTRQRFQQASTTSVWRQATNRKNLPVTTHGWKRQASGKRQR